MRKTVFLVAGILAGLALMLYADFSLPRPDTSSPLSRARIYMGAGVPSSEAPGFECEHIRIRFLNVSNTARSLSSALGRGYSLERASFLAASQQKIIEVPWDTHLFDDSALALGRLPAAGSDELVAGPSISEGDTLNVDGRTYSVVGHFGDDAAVFEDSYVLTADSDHDSLFTKGELSIDWAYLLYPSPGAAGDTADTEVLKKAFPAPYWKPYVGIRRSGTTAFYIFVAGEALVCLCGSLLLTRLLVTLAHAKLPGVLRAPLLEIERRRRLFVGLQISYFGLVIAFALAAAAAPLLHLLILTRTSESFRQAFPGLVAAYTQGHIVKAAALTFVVNFSLGSLLSITVPSTLIPGSGILIAIFRPAAWGLVLAPVYAGLLHRMTAHSFTLLLEGNGYVAAAFFALLYPISLFSNPDGKPLARRYLGALYLNLKGNLIVAAILAVAAVYEAVEVILAIP